MVLWSTTTSDASSTLAVAVVAAIGSIFDKGALRRGTCGLSGRQVISVAEEFYCVTRDSDQIAFHREVD